MKQNIKRSIIIAAGWICLVIGSIGVFIPLLPTTPFLLISAACFSSTSEKFYNMLINNKYFGSYIYNYRNNGGVPVKIKIRAILFLWMGLIISMLIVGRPVVFAILGIIGIAVTIHISLLKEGSNKG